MLLVLLLMQRVAMWFSCSSVAMCCERVHVVGGIGRFCGDGADADAVSW